MRPATPLSDTNEVLVELQMRIEGLRGYIRDLGRLDEIAKNSVGQLTRDIAAVEALTTITDDERVICSWQREQIAQLRAPAN